MDWPFQFVEQCNISIFLIILYKINTWYLPNYSNCPHPSLTRLVNLQLLRRILYFCGPLHEAGGAINEIRVGGGGYFWHFKSCPIWLLRSSGAVRGFPATFLVLGPPRLLAVNQRSYGVKKAIRPKLEGITSYHIYIHIIYNENIRLNPGSVHRRGYYWLRLLLHRPMETWRWQYNYAPPHPPPSQKKNGGRRPCDVSAYASHFSDAKMLSSRV